MTRGRREPVSRSFRPAAEWFVGDLKKLLQLRGGKAEFRRIYGTSADSVEAGATSQYEVTLPDPSAGTARSRYLRRKAT